jgi:hypothetical protein
MDAILEIFKPVMEAHIILAAHYVKACGRKTITGKDLEYGWKYAARNVTGRQIGALYPEVWADEEEEEEEEEELEVVPDDDEPFVRYIGTDDDMALKMNECYDTWTEWEPSSPAEESLKKSIDKTSEHV